MWLLLFISIFVNPVTLSEHEDGTVVLNSFATFEECQTVRNHVGYWMADAYPFDRSFTIACRATTSHGRPYRKHKR